MLLLHSGKNSTTTRKPGVETCQSTDRPILFCFIIWTRNGNIFDDRLNITPITIRSCVKDPLSNVSNNFELRVFPSNIITLFSSKI